MSNLFKDVKIAKINPNYNRLIADGYTHKVTFSKDVGGGLRHRELYNALTAQFGDPSHLTLWGGGRYHENKDAIWHQSAACQKGWCMPFVAYFRGVADLDSYIVSAKLSGELDE